MSRPDCLSREFMRASETRIRLSRGSTRIFSNAAGNCRLLRGVPFLNRYEAILVIHSSSRLWGFKVLFELKFAGVQVVQARFSCLGLVVLVRVISWIILRGDLTRSTKSRELTRRKRRWSGFDPVPSPSWDFCKRLFGLSETAEQNIEEEQ